MYVYNYIFVFFSIRFDYKFYADAISYAVSLFIHKQSHKPRKMLFIAFSLSSLPVFHYLYAHWQSHINVTVFFSIL